MSCYPKDVYNPRDETKAHQKVIVGISLVQKLVLLGHTGISLGIKRIQPRFGYQFQSK